jgi:fused signal recognition particle receptor
MNWFKNFFDKVFQPDSEEVNNEEKNNIINSKILDEESLLEIEEKLLRLDCGIEFSEFVIAQLAKFKGQINLINAQEKLTEICINSLKEAQEQVSFNFSESKKGLQIILVVGVNGVGKTTSIGKLAHYFVQKQLKVLIAPCDTFRAAAPEQLEKWAKRANAEFYAGEGKKADAILYEAIKKSEKEKIDILLVDTAGRLQNKKTLMDELTKLHSVIQKHASAETTIHTLLVLDATTGQNGYLQAVSFNEATKLSGIVLSKFDGTARGGIIFSIAHNLKLPIAFLGVGEKIDQLLEFDLKYFLDKLNFDFSKV